MSDNRQEPRNINHVMLRPAQISYSDSLAPKYASADNDDKIITLWLHGKSFNTQEYYRSDAHRFVDFVQKPLNRVALDDLHTFAQEIDTEELADSSKRRMLSSIKSLFTFACKVGYLKYDVSQLLKLPKVKDTLIERILSEEEIKRIIHLENHPRNRLIVEMLFITGLRVSELSNLKWSDLQKRDTGGQMTVCGKGQKTRTLLIPQDLWIRLTEYMNGNLSEGYVYKGKSPAAGLNRSTILRIVRKAATRAGIDKPVSPHWFRHTHATVAAQKAPLHVVQQSLGHSSIQTTGKYLHIRPDDCSSNYIDL